MSSVFRYCCSDTPRSSAGVKATSGSRKIPVSVKPDSVEGMSIFLKEPATTVTLTFSTPGLGLSYAMYHALEQKRQPTVQIFINPFDEVGGGHGAGTFPKFKAHLRLLKVKPPHRRRHKPRHHPHHQKS